MSLPFQEFSKSEGVFGAPEHLGVVGGRTAGIEDGDYLHTPSL
jgi:hypothetical protein